MSRLFRLVLSCLLALALPMQGHAAQTMLFCGPASAGAVHDHGTGIAADASAGSPASDLPQPKCSVCASCCFLAVLPGTWLTPAALPGSFDYALASFEPPAGRVPGGLERPPRPRSA